MNALGNLLKEREAVRVGQGLCDPRELFEQCVFWTCGHVCVN